MTSHGTARTAKFRSDEQRKQDQDKIQKYRALEDQLRHQIVHELYGSDTFQLTSKLLRINPEYYTVWNVRRRCLISGLLSKPQRGSWPSTELPSSSVNATQTPSSDVSLPSSSTETPQIPDSQIAGKTGTTAESGSPSHSISSDAAEAEVIRSELLFTVPLLQEFPKCYWIWNYRLWILNQATTRLDSPIARGIWEEELGLLSKMLHRDRRNFHAWTYRRLVVEQLEGSSLSGKSMVEPEFAYTTKMISGDLSNFSAWHNRSRLIPRLLNERHADHNARKQFLDNEFENIRNGLNVGPEDQSLWYYHQFLMATLIGDSTGATIVPDLSPGERQKCVEREIVEIMDLLEDYKDIKLIYEALVDYKLATVRLGPGKLRNQDQLQVSEWLAKLKELDPKRQGRWHDLERQVGSLS